MILAVKIITVLILPPGCIILSLIIMIFFLPRKSKWVPAPLLVILYLLSIQPVSDLLLLPLENAYPPVTENEIVKNNELEGVQAIVVLGGGAVRGSPEGQGHDILASDAFKRAVYGYTLSSTYKLPIIFSGGKVFDYEPEPEAEAAARLYQSLGLDEKKFTAESGSRNTWDNAKEIAGLEIKKAVLVTSAYHMKRGVYCFERNCINVIPAPTDYKCTRGMKYNTLSFLPSISSLNGSYLALHEYIGLVFYKIAH
ncbi:MAG: YdcF family protein [Treponema sp.]|jgi:uncharacterized SAM-binding protein YcdF (DUF218 family)|nr:YdcF family protein [Treponema sp.]